MSGVCRTGLTILRQCWAPCVSLSRVQIIRGDDWEAAAARPDPSLGVMTGMMLALQPHGHVQIWWRSKVLEAGQVMYGLVTWLTLFAIDLAAARALTGVRR